MANNRKTTKSRNIKNTITGTLVTKSKGRNKRKQVIMSEPSKILVGTYITKSGDTKNKYKKNPNAKPIKTIYHEV